MTVDRSKASFFNPGKNYAGGVYQQGRYVFSWDRIENDEELAYAALANPANLMLGVKTSGSYIKMLRKVSALGDPDYSTAFYPLPMPYGTGATNDFTVLLQTNTIGGDSGAVIQGDRTVNIGTATSRAYSSTDNILAQGKVSVFSRIDPSTATIQDLDRNWPQALGLVNCRMRMTSGSFSGNEYLISSWTNTTSVVVDTADNFSGGDTFTILPPELDCPETRDILFISWFDYIESALDSNLVDATIDAPAGKDNVPAYRRKLRWCIYAKDPGETYPASTTTSFYDSIYVSKLATMTVGSGTTVALDDIVDVADGDLGSYAIVDSDILSRTAQELWRIHSDRDGRVFQWTTGGSQEMPLRKDTSNNDQLDVSGLVGINSSTPNSTGKYTVETSGSLDNSVSSIADGFAYANATGVVSFSNSNAFVNSVKPLGSFIADSLSDEIQDFFPLSGSNGSVGFDYMCYDTTIYINPGYLDIAGRRYYLPIALAEDVTGLETTYFVEAIASSGIWYVYLCNDGTNDQSLSTVRMSTQAPGAHGLAFDPDAIESGSTLAYCIGLIRETDAAGTVNKMFGIKRGGNIYFGAGAVIGVASISTSGSEVIADLYALGLECAKDFVFQFRVGLADGTLSRVQMETRWKDGSANVIYEDDIAVFGKNASVSAEVVMNTARVPNLTNVDGPTLRFEVTCSDSGLGGAVYVTEVGWDMHNTSRYPFWSAR